ncbi:MAG: acyclic terpene utilization AtuA family protein [Bacteroidota bacterium]
MKNTIRIASGQGFWGDLQRAPIDQARGGPIDYLVMDYLAEVTMSILQKQKLRNPAFGYARDFVEVVTELLPDIKEKGFTIVSNAGGVNPLGCRDAILANAAARGIAGVRIAVVTGDDLLGDLDTLLAEGVELKHMETGEPLAPVRDQMVSANAYLGAGPIVEALAEGADVVITGRTTDTGLTLAPMIHAFGWDPADWDKMAAGTVAGHILECGAQSSGGNFTDWDTVPDMARIGFPIVEARPDGTFTVTKHDGTGGLVSTATVAEQLLYEIGDPTDYITPDCVADFTSIHLEADGENRVRVHGIAGSEDTAFYKVSAAYADGWKASSTLVYAWPDAAKKARAAADILKARLDRLGLSFEEYRAELIGLNALTEDDDARRENDLDEVMLRVSVRAADRAPVEQFGREIAPLILTGPSAVTGFAGGRPKPSEVIAYWPALIPKDRVTPEVTVVET